MSIVNSCILELWGRCITETMFLRGHCHKRPSLYYTESGSMVLDARPVNQVDRDIINAIFVICNLIANERGFYEDVSVEVASMFVWKKGGQSCS